MIRKVMQGLIGIMAGVGGFFLSRVFLDFFLPAPDQKMELAVIGLGVVLCGLIGYLAAPKIMSGIEKFTNWLLAQLFKIPIQDIGGGVVGLILGLLIANLISGPVSSIKYVGPYISLTGSLFLGYVGLSLGIKKRDEMLAFLGAIVRFGGKEKTTKSDALKIKAKILDTSVIIDGRIADIYKTGFVEGSLIIPNFVLDELRHIADSSDLLKRNRGRRGLDILNKLRKEFEGILKIVDKDYEDISEVDSKLVRLAQDMNGCIITNDFNLNKVAQVQGVAVLNINELANAVKPVVLPGEEMVIHLIKEGKEMGQGIAYLDDGTMIVVENGKRFMGQTITVLVTSVLQTAAGRMIFAKPKATDRRQMGVVHELDGRGDYQCLT